MARPGWLRLWRALQDHRLWLQKPYAEGQAWVDILMRVSFKHSTTSDPKRKSVIRVSPGEAIISIRGTAADWGWSKNRVIRFLNMLRNDDMIEYASEYSHTKLKVLNWKKYQGSDDETETDTGTKASTKASTDTSTDWGRTRVRTRRSLEEDKKTGEGEEGKEVKKGDTRPSDAAPQDVKAAIAALTDHARRCGIKMIGKKQCRDEFSRLLAAGFGTGDIVKVLEANRGGDIIKIDFGAEPPLPDENTAERTMTRSQYTDFLKRFHKGDALPVKRSRLGVFVRQGENWVHDEDLSNRYFEDKKREWNSQSNEVKWDIIKAERIKKMPPGYDMPPDWKPEE